MTDERRPINDAIALVCCPGNTHRNTLHLVDDRSGRGDPDERRGRGIVAVDERLDLAHQIRDATERAALDRPLAEQAEPLGLQQVEPTILADRCTARTLNSVSIGTTGQRNSFSSTRTLWRAETTSPVGAGGRRLDCRMSPRSPAGRERTARLNDRRAAPNKRRDCARSC